MWNEGTADSDDFNQRLRQALNRVSERPTAAPDLEPGGNQAPRDDFGDRLSRAMESARGPDADRRHDPNGTSSDKPPVGDLDPELRIVVENWPRLPAFVKTFILSMVQANQNRPAAA